MPSFLPQPARVGVKNMAKPTIKTPMRRAADILTGRFGEKWAVGIEHTVLNVRIEDSTFDGKPSKVAVFTVADDAGDREVFSGSSVIVRQAEELLEEASAGKDVFPLVAVITEKRSKASKFSYQQLE